MLEKVREKLDAEMAQAPKGRYASAVRSAVYQQLLGFCGQSEEFCEAVFDSSKTINDCCEEIMKGCGSSISDLEVYRKVVAFYFPGADVEMILTINLSADAEKNPCTAHKKKAVVLDLFDFL